MGYLSLDEFEVFGDAVSAALQEEEFDKDELAAESEDDQLGQMFEEADTSKDSKLDLKELTVWASKQFGSGSGGESLQSEEDLLKAFARVFPESDKNKDGYLSLDEFEVFGDAVSAALQAK